MKNTPWYIYAMLAFSTISWGSGFIAGRYATEDFDPMTVAFLRFFFAAIVLLPMLFIIEKNRKRPKGKDWLLFSMLGLTGIALYNICFFIATKEAPIAKSSLFIASNPVLITILSGLFLKEKITKRNIIGLVLAFIGAAVIITEGDFLKIVQAGFQPIDFILLAAVICWALYSVLGKVALQRFSSLQSTTYAVVIGTVMLLPFAIATSEWKDYVEASTLTWISIFQLSIIISVISFIMYYYGIQKIGAARASIFINLMPLSAVILAVGLLDEPLLPIHLIGAILVLSGVAIGTRANQKKDIKEKELLPRAKS